ncbi:MAG: hypothetical protein IKB02_05575 [Clostridia bacterium]|nr:hypothetical protein [Clostridia bacterium]
MDDGTQIDKLQIDISVIEQNTTARINQLTQALDGLYNKLSDINNITNKLGKGTGSGERKPKDKSYTETITMVDKLGNKYTAMTRQVSKVGGEMKTVTTQFDKHNKVLKKTTVEIDKLGNKTTEIFGGETAKGNYSHKGLFNAFKLTAMVHIARKLGRTFGYIAQQGADFTETLNLWETAMGKNLDTATAFVNKMNEAYGVSEKTLMNAQATFKNMLGSLGQISDETAYRLSEGVTQIALDYASLYNQTFAQAMTKFQAALAGQVRPIRSVSGFDITENTLFQLYQSLGGTKTMRQLSRTEKQLLSIYAIFQQMEASGTVGDLRKTMESFANQSRVAAESFQEILQYSGVLITHALTQAKVMQYLNGFLIFLADTLKAVAENTGAIQHFGDPFQATTDGALAAGKATDELKGKLLGFDKFNALNTNADDNIGLDEKLLEALSQYSSILSDASMEATEIAEALKTASGLFDENGFFNVDRWEEISKNIKTIAYTLVGLLALKVVTGITKHFITFKDGVLTATEVTKGLGKIIPRISQELKAMGGNVFWVFAAFSVLSMGVIAFISAWDDMSSLQRAIGIIVALTTAVTAFSIALASTHNMAKALSIAAAITGGALFAYSTLTQVVEFADGGLPDKGSLFVAGEAGAELVTNMGGGQSGVMNMEQLESAVARGILVGLSSVDLRDDRPIYVNIDGQRFFTASRDIYRRNGYDVTAKR